MWIQEHTGTIRSIQTTSDGAKVFSIDSKGITLIWQMESQTEDGSFEPTQKFKAAKDEIRLCPNDRDLIGRCVDNNKESVFLTIHLTN